MNKLERETYAEPDFGLIDEFVNDMMSDKEKEETRKKTVEMYKDWTDDDFRHLADNY